jgi:hypothetical protein
LPWRAFSTALQGIAPDERGMSDLIRQCTGREMLPARTAREAWCVVGRRGGKSRIAALIALYLSCFRTYRLSPGERGTLMVIAADRRQAGVVKRYIAGLLHANPMLHRLIAKETKGQIALTNGITIEIHTASFRTIRGYTVVGAILDEIAFWRTDDSANPDAEILNALRPAMATVSGALLVAISSPYARRGELWRVHRNYFGNEATDILCWQAPTWAMNPTLPKDSPTIAQAFQDDEAVASAEYGAEFRRDIESFIAREVLDASTVAGRRELAPLSDTYYRAFVDPSGGASDSFTLGIAHNDKGRGVLDVLRETKPPFSPESVVADYAALLHRYRVPSVVGDRYAGEWPREQFRKQGIDYEPSDKSKSDIYRDLLPLLNSDKVELLDLPRLVSQFASLERRTARGGRDSIDHGPKAHDDLANAAAGALLLASTEREPLIFR